MLLRKLPSVDRLIALEEAKSLIASHSRERVVVVCREVVGEIRERLRILPDGPAGGGDAPVDTAEILDRVGRRLRADEAAGLCRAINATGVILHTGLGRAVLPKAAVDAIAAEQRGYSLLETDRATGERGRRDAHVVRLLRELTGCEDAAVVNNNAAATLIVLKSLAAGREVIVSRGQLVEIGGSFRIPEVMEASGARLVEVGTTNKTHLADYERRIGPQTGALLRVHTSNFRVVGFTESVPIEELVALGAGRNVPVIDDLGSGAMTDLRPWGIHDEPVVADSIRAGVAVATFSGDKLLGGPQAGIIVGKKEPIAAIKRDPLYRALRLDKLVLTALESTLKLYRNPDRLLQEHPTLRMIALGGPDLRGAAERLCVGLNAIPGVRAEPREDSSEIGGGSVPALQIPTWTASVTVGGMTAEDLTRSLRTGTPPVFARIRDDAVLLDLRTILEGESEEIIGAIRRVIEKA